MMRIFYIAFGSVTALLTALFFAVSWQLMVAYNALLTPGSPPQIVVLNQSREITYPAPGEPFEVNVAVASWYGHPFIGRLTANGETYTGDQMTAAHRDWPMGTWVELRNPETGAVTAVRINDRGPYVRGRDLDLSVAAAEALGIIEQGVATLEARVLIWGDQ